MFTSHGSLAAHKEKADDASYGGRTRAARTLWPVLLLLILSLVLSACGGTGTDSGNSGNTKIDLTVSPNPPVVGPAQLTITLKDGSGNAINDATVTVEGDMTHAGMVPVQADATSMGNGTYMVNNFNFNMGGDWVLTVSATLPGGDKAQGTFNYNGVAGGMEMTGTMTPGMEMTGTMTPGMEMTGTMTPGLSDNMEMQGMPTPTDTPCPCSSP